MKSTLKNHVLISVCPHLMFPLSIEYSHALDAKFYSIWVSPWLNFTNFTN